MASMLEAKVAGLPPEPVLRLTVEQYHSMIDAGILNDDSHVELLEGWLVPSVSKNPPHIRSSQVLRKAIEKILPLSHHVRCEAPLTLVDSEPEPDIAIVPGDDDTYGIRHPGQGEISLVAEVADSTLLRDRTAKKRIYARAGIPVYWVLDLNGRRLLEFRDPRSDGAEPDYASQSVLNESDSVTLSIAGAELGSIKVAALLPKV